MAKTETKCKLCRTNPANQTGSHLLTAWLVASMFDKQKRNRDSEIMYEIAPFDSSIPFIGRSVSPETIEDHLGRALTDEETKNQENRLVLDYIFCSDCEKRFKTIEDEFLKKVHQPIEKTENDESTTFEFACNLLIRLFFLIQVWRVSTSGNLNFSFGQTFEERIRTILDKILDIKIKNTFENASKHSGDLTAIPMCIIKSSKDFPPTSKPFMPNPLINKPFFLIINDYVVLLYEKESHTRSTPHNFYGISRYLKKDWTNFKETKFTIGFLNNSQWT